MSWLVKVLKALFAFGGMGKKQDLPTENKQEATIPVEVDVVAKESSPIATVHVSESGFVEPQEVVFDFGLFKIVEQEVGGGKKTVVAWGDVSKGEAVVRPVKAKIYYSYSVKASHFSVSGEASVMNAEDAVVRVQVPRFEYPVTQVDSFSGPHGERKIYYHVLQYPVEVRIEIQRIEFLERGLVSRAIIMEAMPVITLPQIIVYKAYLSPYPTVRSLTVVTEKKSFKKDSRPPEKRVITEVVGRAVYPTLEVRSMSETMARDDRWQAVKDNKFFEYSHAFSGSKKSFSVKFSKNGSLRIFVQYRLDSSEEWKQLFYGEELDDSAHKGLRYISLPDETRYVDVQAYVYPKDVLYARGVNSMFVDVYQDVLVKDGYSFERMYASGEVKGNIVGVRIYTEWGDADDAPRMWTVNFRVRDFLPRHVVHVLEMNKEHVVVGVRWAGGGSELAAENVSVDLIHIDKFSVTKYRVGGLTDSDGKVVLPMFSATPEDGDVLIIRYRGLFDERGFQHGYYPVGTGDIVYVWRNGEWVKDDG